jgi:hypothetical protein
MNFLKNLKDKIKIIFHGKEKEQETEIKEEEQVKELIQSEVQEEAAEKEREAVQEKTVLTDNIRETVKKFPLKSKVVLLGNAIEKLDNIELFTLAYYVDTYSLIISENKEYLWINLKSKEYDAALKLFMVLGKEEYSLVYEDEYLIGRDSHVEVSAGDYMKIINYKISVVKYIKIKIAKFLCLYYSEILKYRKYYADSENNMIISNIGEYINKFLAGRKRNFEYSELQKYFEKELNRKIISRVSHNEDGIFYFEYGEERYIKNKYIFSESEDGRNSGYFKTEFKNFVSLKEFNEQELSELSNIEVYENLTGSKKLIFYNENKKSYIQNVYKINKNDIMTV